MSAGAMDAKDHWERVYSTKATNAVSWYQEHAASSVQLIRATGVPKDAAIIDVGGGASTLTDDLLADGYSNLTILDLSHAALEAARERLGSRAAAVRWLEADITTITLPPLEYDVWHDRAVFHFLTAEDDRAAYVRAVLRSVKPGGHVIVATFAEDGPEKCSGLPVVRYNAQLLHSEFGDSFKLLDHQAEEHHTPFGTIQKFVYCYCRKVTSSGVPARAT
jgi:ubiquinone/menaquinone biosynthesis C-methylase UbiE